MMVYSRNGGPAFPAEVNNNTDEEVEGFLDEVVLPGARHEYSGMTLRDYFAAQALQGQMQREKDFGKTVREQGFAKYAAHIAETSYQLADAMLSARGESK